VKYLTIAILFTFSQFVSAECVKQTNLEFETSVIEKAAKHGNHGAMDIVKISMHASIKNIPFKSILLFQGELAEFWLPIATTVHGDRVVATITGYTDSIQNFEFLVTYSDGNCHLGEYGIIKSAYNKPLKQDK